MLAVIAHQINATHCRRTRRQFRDYLPASISTPIVNQDDLVLRRDARQYFAQAPAQLSDRSLAIINWRDDRKRTPLREIAMGRSMFH